MATFRIMSYHINGGRSAAGDVAPELCAAVIKEHQPDLVMLQRIGSSIGNTAVEHLATKVGLTAYSSGIEGGCAFLSRFPLKYLQELPLGFGGQCLQADLEFENERVHLFNLSFSWNHKERQQQAKLLAGEDMLNNPSLTCATIVCGDFGLPLWGGELIQLNDKLHRSGYPIWSANFPGKVPLWGRDRVYFRGPIKALDGNVVMTTAARKASTHLPLVLTVKTLDTREVLKVKKILRVPSKQIKPVCG